MKKYLLIVVIILLNYVLIAQNFSNKGKDFWLGYGYHQVMPVNNGQDMVLYFATDQLTTVTVSIPGLGYTQTYSNIPANTIFTTPIMPKTGVNDSRLLVEGISNKGIHIVSTKPIVAYAHIYNSSVSGACVLLPTPTLGKEYYSINYTNNSNQPNANCWFYVVAADTGITNIEIVPSAATVSGWVAGSTHTVSLTQGQIYNVMGALVVNTNCGGNNQVPCKTEDLTGSSIKSIASGTSGCKPIAVFSGSGRISLTCNNTPSSSDNYMVQAFPKAAWGKRFLTVSTGGNMTRNIYRVCVSDPLAVVKINGVVTTLPLINNFYYEIPFTQNPQKIEANLPITVAQYVTSQGACSNTNPGDPEVIYLSPVEQSISDVLFNSNLLVAPSTAQNPHNHLVNIIIPNGGTAISSFKLDLVTVPASSFTVHPQDPLYSYIKIPNLALGKHTLYSDSGFNAIAYGFASAESYGYNAGTNVRNFNQNLEIQSQYGIINNGTANSCTNSPFRFNIYLPDSALSNSGPTAGTIVPIRYDSMKWEVTNSTSFVPNNFPIMVIGNTAYPPAYPLPNKVYIDSITTRNGKTVAWYSLPTNYTIPTSGIDTITVTGYRTNTNDGCASGNETEFEFYLNVSGPPPATFSYNQPGCPADSVRFVETTPQGPIPTVYPTYHFWWNFGDNSPIVTGNSTNPNSPLRTPVHAYAAAGTYRVRFTNITTPGCISDTSFQDIVVPALVNATIAGTTTVCQNSTPNPNITFTITPGPLGLTIYKIKYTLSTNGGAPVAQTDIITSSLVNTIPAPTSIAGTFVYTIVSVENADAAYCTVPIIGQTATVTINPSPTAAISGATVICQNTAAPLVTFTGANATAPYTFTYNINAGANLTLTSTGNNATVAVPTSTVGLYSYNLVSVVDASSTLCSNTANGNIIVEVQATPAATIAGTVSLCQDAAAPSITFTGSNGNAPFTFTYNINGGATITVSSTTNIAVVPVSMAASGVFTYNLLTVQNTGNTTCISNIIGQSATVTINPVPTATISGTTSVCQVAGNQTVTFTGAGGTAPYTFNYSINGVAQPPVTSIGNNAQVIANVATPGTFIYTIQSVTDASSTTCIKNYTTPNEPTTTVVVQATSTATIAGTITICQDAAAPTITFTAANGIAPFTFTYTVTTNGVTGPNQTISSPAGSFEATLTVPMVTPGTLVYTLISVQNTGSINCTTVITGQSATVIINPIPTATISGTTTVCQNTGNQPVTFTGSGGTGASYIFNYTLNGVAQPALMGNNIVANQSSTTFGVFTYIITSVQDAATLCTKTYTTNPPTATVTVNQLATATISTSAATVCQNSTTLPTITFTATGGVAPYRFKYTVSFNGVAGAILTTPYTAFGNSLQISASTNTAGTYLYTLVSVEESANSCVNAQTGSTQITVHPQPTASYTTAAPYCAQKAVTFTPAFGITPTGSVTSWVWDYGDGTGQQIRADGNPFTLTYPTAGIKTVTFKTISDNGCESILFSTPVTINSKPKAGFKSPEACLADTYAQFIDTSTVVGGSIVYWEWNFGDAGSPTNLVAGSNAAAQNPLHAYTFVGQKTVKLIVTTNNGCKDTILQTFFINGEVTKANFTQVSSNYCSNRPVQIKEASVVNVGGLIQVDIYWDNTAAPTIFEQDDNPTPGKIYTHNYPNLQTNVTYKVRYIAYSGFNGVCQKDTIINVLVNASPIAVFAPVQDVCLNGGPVTLNQGTASGGTAVYMGPGVTQSSGVFTFNPLAAGVTIGTSNNVTYTVTTLAGCDSALVRQVKVLAPPVVDTFTITSNKCINNSITFNNTTSNGDGTIVKWIYDWGDGSPIQTFATGADVIHTYISTGVKTATLTLETGYGCRNLPYPLTFTVNPLPVPSYTFSNSVCLPNASISFTNNTANLASNTYLWSFELPSTTVVNTSSLPSPTHIYTTQGPYNTHLIATNITTGCIDSTAIIVINSSTIHPAPVLQFSIIPDVCLNNGTVQLTQGSETSGIAGGPGIYTGNGVSASGVFNPLTAGVGIHTLTYSWTSTFSCPTSITQTVKVLAPPVVDVFITTGNRCERNAIVFHNEVTQGAGNIVTWVYNWGDGSPIQTVSNGNDITHQYAVASNNYFATLYVITSDGCKSLVKPLTVVVNPLPLPNFIYSDTVCLPAGKVLFTNTTANTSSNTYTWVNDDVPPIVKTSINADYTYSNVGPHPVKLIAINATTFCVDSITKNVNSIHPAPLAAFDFSVASVCIGTSVSVIDRSSFADGQRKNWDWAWGDASFSLGQSPAPHTYASAQTFNVTLKVTNSFGCFDDTTRQITVHPFPVVNAGRDSVILQGGQIILTPTVTGNDLSYLWTGTPTPINLSSTIILNPIANPLEDITYKLKATARGGCSREDEVFIKVLKFPEIPNTFTPNRADSRHTYWEIKYLSSYPNNRVQVFTRTGQLVFESRGYITPWDGSYNGKYLPFDTYYFIIEPGTGRQPITGYVTIVK